MKRLIEFPLDGGGSMWVEVDEPEGAGGTVRAARDTGTPEKSRLYFEQAVSKIRPATETVITTLRDLIQQPDEIEMQFGFSLHAEAGVVIAAASTDANYTVTLRWSRHEEEKKPSIASDQPGTGVDGL